MVFNSVAELTRKIFDEWPKIIVDTLRTLAESMPRRIVPAVEGTGLRLVLSINDVDSSNVKAFGNLGVTREEPYWVTPNGTKLHIYEIALEPFLGPRILNRRWTNC